MGTPRKRREHIQVSLRGVPIFIGFQQSPRTVYFTKMVGDPAYKLRVGDYRILMDVDQGTLTILVLKVGHRKKRV
ncbi:MAG: type II toxin-antitoxin system RelE/ParE family toxin [Candidatus Aenigmarchaeota archaeon]|nr:type II toxin-antitoxin system RelE/ParE family toxin [Candidatus Aenigmarchaeota archaeon]